MDVDVDAPDTAVPSDERTGQSDVGTESPNDRSQEGTLDSHTGSKLDFGRLRSAFAFANPKALLDQTRTAVSSVIVPTQTAAMRTVTSTTPGATRTAQPVIRPTEAVVMAPSRVGASEVAQSGGGWWQNVRGLGTNSLAHVSEYKDSVLSGVGSRFGRLHSGA